MSDVRKAALALSDALHYAEAGGLELPESVDAAWRQLSEAIVDTSPLLAQTLGRPEIENWREFLLDNEQRDEERAQIEVLCDMALDGLESRLSRLAPQPNPLTTTKGE